MTRALGKMPRPLTTKVKLRPKNMNAELLGLSMRHGVPYHYATDYQRRITGRMWQDTSLPYSETKGYSWRLPHSLTTTGTARGTPAIGR